MSKRTLQRVRSAQFPKLLHGDSRFTENVPQSAWAELFVVWHHYPAKGIGAPQDYVASPLAIHDEPNPLEHHAGSGPETSVGSFTSASRS